MHNARDWVVLHCWQIVGVLWLAMCVVILHQTVFVQAKTTVRFILTQQQNKKLTSDMQDWKRKKGVQEAIIDSLRSQLQARYTDIPREDQLSVLIDCLLESSHGINLSVGQIKTEPAATIGTYLEQPFHLILEGEFHAVNTFIARIEQSAYVIKVDHLDVARAKNFDAQLQALLHLKAIILPKKVS